MKLEEKPETAAPVACHDCGRAYGGPGWIEAIIPDAIWREISPSHDINGILCISCIAKRLEEAHFQWVPVWLCGTEPLMARTGEPEIHILRNADPKDYLLKGA